MGGRIPINISVPVAGQDKEVCGCTALGLSPAFEGITFTGRCRRINFYCLIDRDAGIGVQQSTLTIVILAIVAVPVDMGGRLRFHIFIDSPQLNGILFKYIARLRSVGNVLDLGICLEDREDFACLSRSTGRRKCVSIPLSHIPVREHLAFGGGEHERLCWDIGLVRILIQIDTGGTCAVLIEILHIDTVSSQKLAAPTRFQGDLAYDPPTVVLFVGVGLIGYFKILVDFSLVDIIIIRNSVAVAHRESCADRMSIVIPTDELIIVTGTAGESRCLQIVNTEAEARVAHDEIVFRRMYTGIQVYTILLYPPLRIDDDIAGRHGVEIIQRGAFLVGIPALQQEVAVGGFVRIRAVFCIGRDVRPISETFYHVIAVMGIARRRLVTVAIDKGTIPISQSVVLAIKANLKLLVRTPPNARCIYIICRRFRKIRPVCAVGTVGHRTEAVILILNTETI